MRYMKFFFYSAKHYNEPPGEVALRIDHMVGIAIHHKAARRGGHCELTTWWALRSTTKPLGEVALRIDHMVGIANYDYFGGTPS